MHVCILSTTNETQATWLHSCGYFSGIQLKPVFHAGQTRNHFRVNELDLTKLTLMTKLQVRRLETEDRDGSATSSNYRWFGRMWWRSWWGLRKTWMETNEVAFWRKVTNRQLRQKNDLTIPRMERTWWPDGQTSAPDTGWWWLNCRADWQNWTQTAEFMQVATPRICNWVALAIGKAHVSK